MTVSCVVDNVTREFRNGREIVRAVNGVSFQVPAGEVTALVGLNGAGKTTLFRMCATLLEPTSGRILIDGINAVKDPYTARQRLGLSLGGERGFYPRASAQDNLLFFADLAGVPGRQRHVEVQRVLEAVGLDDRKTRAVETLSRGQYQRLHIARALLGGPHLLILDEPTSGLDPDVALRIRALIASIAAQGTAVLLSSHSMEEVSELAAHILLLSAGEILARGNVANIVAGAGLQQIVTAHLRAETRAECGELVQRLEGLEHAALRPSGTGWLLTTYWGRYDSQSLPQLRQILAADDPLSSIAMSDAAPTLEDAFLFLSRDSAGE